ncbi:MAG: DUF4381 domain-containing protein [Alphaproteobacteria bacterium]|nr:DUF4381 domain-containing protein [Alphaproteobacteria bacterium]
MEDLRAQLHDIKGLDAISWWPPAPGWWILAGVLILLLIAVFGVRVWRRRRAARWQAHVKGLFLSLRRENDARTKVSALSELLRGLAIQTHGRESCAGLEGSAWLAWLSAHDPAGFNWTYDAKILIEAPYAPDGHIAANDLEPLIKAAERWVK